MYKEKEAYCDPEISRLLKEAGFDWECQSYYGEADKIIPCNGCSNTKLFGVSCARPTQQLAVRYLREKENVFIYPECMYAYKDYNVHEKYPKWWWLYRIRLSNYPLMSNGDERKMFTTYEEAITEALKYSLENIILRRKGNGKEKVEH